MLSRDNGKVLVNIALFRPPVGCSGACQAQIVLFKITMLGVMLLTVRGVSRGLLVVIGAHTYTYNDKACPYINEMSCFPKTVYHAMFSPPKVEKVKRGRELT